LSEGLGASAVVPESLKHRIEGKPIQLAQVLDLGIKVADACKTWT
jgi:hypothetical protein